MPPVQRKRRQTAFTLCTTYSTLTHPPLFPTLPTLVVAELKARRKDNDKGFFLVIVK
ncbi:hypothetical protein M0804_014708 [Polistes exclamans]|nr:hypothetical protein M0804_014711 [Polistes exclamans]KAI4474718.1 hypothetical protein M0804_014708 [Polistes exclamans]